MQQIAKGCLVMTPTEEAFLADIVEKPDDMTPRLIYADWLEEQGQPRAEFIRVQMKLAAFDWDKCGGDFCGHIEKNGSTRHVDCMGAKLRRRERELLFARGCCAGFEWAGPAYRYIGELEQWPNSFRRGFVEVVRLSAADWLEHHGTLRKVCPIREVELTTLEDIHLQFWPEDSRDDRLRVSSKDWQVETRIRREQRPNTRIDAFRVCWPDVTFREIELRQSAMERLGHQIAQEQEERLIRAILN